jgi:hypothetical protein
MWRPTVAWPREIWLPANQAIENAYKDSHTNNSVLVGTDFEEGFIRFPVQREIRSPQNSHNKEFSDYLLKSLRGLGGGPRKPDIVDFDERSFYEIKPITSFTLRRAQAINQHLSLYRQADRIVDEFNQMKRNLGASKGGKLELQDPWVITNSKWMPPKCLTIPNFDNNQYKIETFATDYTTDPNCRGIIVYRVWRKLRKQDEEEQAAAKVVVKDQDQTYDNVIPSADVLRGLVGRYDPNEPDFLVIVPKYIDDAFKRRTPVDVVQKVANLSIPPAFDRMNPIGQFRALSRMGPLATNHPEDLLVVGAIVGVVMLGGAAIVLLAPEAIAAFGGDAVAGGGGAEVISLAARRLASSAAAETIKKAAGIILIFGTIQAARADNISFSRVSAMRTIPLSSVAPYRSTNAALSSGLCIADSPENFPSAQSEIRVGDTVMFDSEPHCVVARIVAYPNSLSDLE